MQHIPCNMHKQTYNNMLCATLRHAASNRSCRYSFGAKAWRRVSHVANCDCLSSTLKYTMRSRLAAIARSVCGARVNLQYAPSVACACETKGMGPDERAHRQIALGARLSFCRRACVSRA
jgi:hypothetical protein